MLKCMGTRGLRRIDRELCPALANGRDQVAPLRRASEHPARENTWHVGW